MSAPPDVRIALLGGFDLTVDDAPVTVAGGSERLLAFAALRCRAAVPRAAVAGTLWPETTDQCAYANLRSALSRPNAQFAWVCLKLPLAYLALRACLVLADRSGARLAASAFALVPRFSSIASQPFGMVALR